jgi:anti-anti-sigma regulatory factor
VLVINNELVIIDVSEATFIDSSVIHALFDVEKRGRACGTHLRLQIGTAQIVKRSLEINGILDLFDVDRDRQEALAAS